MKLQTSIKPRRDGVVNVTGVSGRTYVFAADADGDLCAVVEDQADLARLLVLGDFFPANADDNQAALALLKTAAPADPDAGDDLGEDDEPDDDPVDMDAAPIEVAKAPIEIPAASAAPAAAAAARASRRARA